MPIGSIPLKCNSSPHSQPRPLGRGEEGEIWGFNEGCLSIPDVREDVYRHEQITISYLDEQFNQKTAVFDGLIARVIQHEYDHIEGKLFIDYLKPFKI